MKSFLEFINEEELDEAKPFTYKNKTYSCSFGRYTCDGKPCDGQDSKSNRSKDIYHQAREQYNVEKAGTKAKETYGRNDIGSMGSRKSAIDLLSKHGSDEKAVQAVMDNMPETKWDLPVGYGKEEDDEHAYTLSRTREGKYNVAVTFGMEDINVGEDMTDAKEVASVIDSIKKEGSSALLRKQHKFG